MEKPQGREWLGRVVRFPLTRIILACAALAAASILTTVLVPAGVELLLDEVADAGWAIHVLLIPAMHLTYVGYVHLVERRSAGELSRHGALQELGTGVLVGAALGAGTTALIAALGYYHVVAQNPWNALIWPFVIALMSAYTDELLVRGIVFRITEESLGTWLALLISSAFIGLAHVANPDATPLRILAVVLEGGVLLGAAYVLTRRLWLAIGIRFAWHFALEGIFGVNVSGDSGRFGPEWGVLESRYGPEILSGGGFGVAGSIITVALGLAVGAAFLVLAYRRNRFTEPFWRRNNRLPDRTDRGPVPTRFIPRRQAEPQPSPGADRLRSALHYYPFTLLGTALLAAACYLAGSAFATQNSYEFVLSAAATLVLAMLAADGRLQARRMAAVELSWKGEPLHARTPASIDLTAAGARRPHYFYRLHALATGRLRAGNRAAVHLRAEVSSASEQLPLTPELPVCGQLAVRARLAVRDVFGLTRNHLPGRDERRLLTVRPAPLALRSAPTIDATVGDDTTRRTRSADEERYYMREYQPGDRLKDINWKASSRAGELITRISPVSEEQTKLLHMELRHFRPAGPETLDSLLHLNYLKSWLLAFLRAVKSEHEDYTFRVITGTAEYPVETVEEIDELACDLASVTFMPAAEYRPEVQPRELFIFTTAFDAALASYVGRLGDTAIHLYRTVSALPRRSGTRRDGEGERVPLLRQGRLASILPGTWALRRDRFMLGPEIRGPNVRVEDAPLEVGLS